VVDLDASIVFAAPGKENAQATYKGGVGFCPNLATCDNTDDVLAGWGTYVTASGEYAPRHRDG
jgi:hypothetical protein